MKEKNTDLTVKEYKRIEHKLDLYGVVFGLPVFGVSWLGVSTFLKPPSFSERKGVVYTIVADYELMHFFFAFILSIALGLIFSYRFVKRKEGNIFQNYVNYEMSINKSQIIIGCIGLIVLPIVSVYTLSDSKNYILLFDDSIIINSSLFIDEKSYSYSQVESFKEGRYYDEDLEEVIIDITIEFSDGFSWNSSDETWHEESIDQNIRRFISDKSGVPIEIIHL